MNSFSSLRSLGLALVASGSLMSISAPARADLLVAYDNDLWTNTGPLSPADWADNMADPTPITAHGTSQFVEKAAANGWSQSFGDFSNYLGFTVAANPGYQMNFTSLNVTSSTFGGPTNGFAWGYRVDNGSGTFGAWNLSPINTSTFNFDPLNWDFADFSATRVEFGFFNSAAGSGDSINAIVRLGGINEKDFAVNGTVSAVPEPSTLALAAIATLAVLVVRNRRKTVLS